MFIRFDVIYERDRRTDRQTDGHCMTAKTALASHRAVKIMKRNIPVQLLEVLENLISCCHSYVKWNNVWSSVLDINFGVR